MKLNVYYDSETDTLSLWNGQPASAGADVAENLTVDLDAEGEAVGFTLDHASEILKEIGARPFLAGNPKDLTLEDSERSSGILKAVDALVFSVRNPEGLTSEGSEWSEEILKAIGARSSLVENPQGLTPEDNQRKTEMPKAVGGHQFVVLDPEGLTPEDMEKLAIRSTVWVGQLGHFVDSGKK